jgi:hypothetical protein
MDPDDVDVTKNYLLKEEWEALKKQVDQPKLRQFYVNFFDKYGKDFTVAASEQGIPDWLLKGVILGERIDMTEYGIFDEPTLESLGFGDSVGLAQITVSTAIKYNLVPGVKEYNQLSRRLKKAKLHSTIVALETEIRGAFGHIRNELLSDKTNIKASAKYLRNLLQKAISASRNESVSGPKVFREFGDFDWNVIDLTTSGAWDKLAQSHRILRSCS